MRDWKEFDTFEKIYKPYWVSRGEGNTMATQAVIAVNKLVYKWYNDGDVYDNTYGMPGWCNDLSSYANWLYKYIPMTQPVLDRITKVSDEDGYTELLYDLCGVVFDEYYLKGINRGEKMGSIYECEGPFEFVEYEDDEDEYYDEEDEEWY